MYCEWGYKAAVGVLGWVDVEGCNLCCLKGLEYAEGGISDRFTAKTLSVSAVDEYTPVTFSVNPS